MFACFLPQWAGWLGSACVDTELGTLHNEETTREGTDFHLQKVSIPGFGWNELVLLCSHVALDRTVGISVVSFEQAARGQSFTRCLASFSPKKRTMNDELRMATSKG